MPELPEVETIKRGLSKFIMNKKLTQTDILCEKSFIGTPITGKIKNIRRFGKGKVVALAPGHTLAVWENPNFQKLFKNAIRFAVPSASEK